MTAPITPSAAAAREAARSSTGQFGHQAHAEADIDLSAAQPASDPAAAAETQLRELLGEFTVLPATDGRGTDFETAFLDRYREAAAFAVAHPNWEEFTSLGYQHSLVGLETSELGRERSTSIVEADEESGGEGLVLVVHTRNGGGNRECWHDEEDEPDDGGRVAGCTGCVMDAITEHQNYLTDKDEDYDFTYADLYFSIPDQNAARTAVHAGQHGPALRSLKSIREGLRTPWAGVGRNLLESTDRAPSQVARTLSSKANSLRDRAETAGDRAELGCKLEAVLQADEFPDPDALVTAAATGRGYIPWYPSDLRTAAGKLHTQPYGYRNAVEGLVKRREEVATSRRAIEEIDEVVPALGEDSPVRALLTRERKRAERRVEVEGSLHDRDAQRVDGYLAPFRTFVAEARRDDPDALRTEADRLETEATRQEMLIGWPEDPDTCPSSLEQLRG